MSSNYSNTSSIKTSLTHPLQIAEVPAASGTIGITFCPGKRQHSAFSGQWHRDLDLDLNAVRDWGGLRLSRSSRSMS